MGCVPYMFVFVPGVHACMQVQRLEITSGSFSVFILSLGRVSLNLELTGSSRLACTQALGTVLWQAPQDWDCRCVLWLPAFHLGAGEADACAVGTLLTEPSL